MKSEFIIASVIVLLGFSGESAKGQSRISPEERYYRQSVFRSWRDSMKLLKTSVDPERQILEIDLAASAFDYFFLLENNEIKKNPVVEKYIKELFNSGEIRKSIITDPLNRSGISGTGNPRGTSSNKIITDDEYKNLKARFLDFVKP